MPFDPEYIRTVLRENFEDAKTRLFEPLMAIHAAHLVMLTERGIVSRRDAGALARAIGAVDPDAVRRATYDGSCEDLFFFVDRVIAGACDADVAGRLHTARSRNDIDMTMYRMRLRDEILALVDGTIALRRALLDLAAAHRETIFPAHTHTQPAQPTTVAHYLLAVVEPLERDATRLLAAYETTNRCPLGACAITGTGFDIDRARTSALLGFAAPTGNTYASIAAVDYLLEAAAAAGVSLVGLGRFVQDMLLWSTVEVGYLRLDDGFVQTSSIMPQKRNPVALEHARGLASKGVAGMQAIASTLHNTPFGDIVDTEDDLQPLVAAAFRDAARALTLTAAAMAHAGLDVERMRSRATLGGVTATELADTLVRESGLPFRVAHAIAARVAAASDVTPADALAALVAREARERGYDVHWSGRDVTRALGADEFVAVRRTPGGPAPEVTAAAIEAARHNLARDEATVTTARDDLARAAAARDRALQDLSGVRSQGTGARKDDTASP
ncbi:MAG TPA: argininosuccinate lyase [Vicinamibacterales bacterium]|jgi:argininosuccinate lyase|nr:argininosuccinate lyase [Vicinamibacterales bacterium]